MEIISTLATEKFEYKGLVIERKDVIVKSSISTLSAYPLRIWTINNDKSLDVHTFKINENTHLAYYPIPASRGGERVVLKDFSPECGFYLGLTDEIKAELDRLGKFFMHTVVEY